MLGSILERDDLTVLDLERLDLNSPNGKRFSDFFKKVKINIRAPGSTKWEEEEKPISGVVPQAGHYILRNKDDKYVTVQVCFPIAILDSP